MLGGYDTSGTLTLRRPVRQVGFGLWIRRSNGPGGAQVPRHACEVGDVKRLLLVSAAVAACSIGPLVLTLAARGQQARPVPAPDPSMSFFVTSRGLGDGANFGGLGGADYHCQQLAAAVGSPKTFYAYLSNRRGGSEPVFARDRIGSGPWYNAKGLLIARNLEELHEKGPLARELALTEHGEMVAMHDILTGSQPDGTSYPDREDHTCNMYTSNNEGSIQVGHSDRSNGSSWNSAHATEGCSQQQLEATGGAGLLYCFAID